MVIGMEDGEARLDCVHLWDVGHIVDWQIPLNSFKAKRGGVSKLDYLSEAVKDIKKRYREPALCA